MALNGLICADVPLRNYSFTHSDVDHMSYLVLMRSGLEKNISVAKPSPSHLASTFMRYFYTFVLIFVHLYIL